MIDWAIVFSVILAVFILGGSYFAILFVINFTYAWEQRQRDKLMIKFAREQGHTELANTLEELHNGHR